MAVLWWLIVAGSEEKEESERQNGNEAHAVTNRPVYCRYGRWGWEEKKATDYRLHAILFGTNFGSLGMASFVIPSPLTGEG